MNLERFNLAHYLSLTRPLAMLDVETTDSLDGGEHRIIQIAVTKYYPDKDPVHWKTYVNPSVPISSEAMAVHHITDVMVAEAPTFASLAEGLIRKVLTNTDFSGHSVDYDLKVIRGECRRIGFDWSWETCDAIVIDTLQLRRVLFSNALSAVYEELIGIPLDGAHDAAIDVAATETILVKLLEKFPHVPRGLPALAAFCLPNAVDKTGKIVWKNGEACLAFGKNGGKSLKSLVAGTERGYLSWMCKNDFPEDTKMILRDALAGKFPVYVEED